MLAMLSDDRSDPAVLLAASDWLLQTFRFGGLGFSVL
jgi:hypothetical protein